ncbi:hypothetical protein E4U41_005835 [Claviceps citrina]|nr:hypothetical protein E4U41_005835 [Claviceps citrina]
METYHGCVRTPADAIKLFEACRLGLLPRVQRRLSEKERQSIRSGSVFVWDEREAGMRRWTDGKSWSASRVSGSFLTYREMEGKRGGGFASARRGQGKSPESSRGSDEDHDDGEPEGYRYKADGLMKQSFSITTSTCQHLHLISYYSRPQPGHPELPQPSTDPALRAIVPPKGMYPESSMGETNQTPALTRTPMHQPYLIAPHHPNAPPPPPPPPPHSAYGQYAHPGYGWPLSPDATPPYTHYVPASFPHGVPIQPLPPPHAPYLTHGHAPPQMSQYDRPALPPLQHPQPIAAATLAPYHAAASPPPRYPDSPGYRGRQDSAGPLPALSSVAGPVSHPGMTPPTREPSASPPKVKSEGAMINGPVRICRLSGLLNPLSGSDARSKSGGNHGVPSSTRTSGVVPESCGNSEDTRALRMLDRKFCL